jgi:acetyltransferase
MVLVAEYTDPNPKECRIRGVGRMNKLRSGKEAGGAVLVSDEHQGLGLGHESLRRVVQIARDEELSQVSAEMLNDNVAMQIIMKRLGFRVRAAKDFSAVRAFLDL